VRYTRRGTALPCPYTRRYNVVPHLSGNRYTALPAAMRYILKAESYDRTGARGKLYCIIAGSAVTQAY